MVTKEVEATVERVETEEVVFCDRCGGETDDPKHLYPENSVWKIRKNLNDRFTELTHDKKKIETRLGNDYGSAHQWRLKDSRISYTQLYSELKKIHNSVQVESDYDLCKNCIREFDETREVIGLPPEDQEEQSTITRKGLLGWIWTFIYILGIGFFLGSGEMAFAFLCFFWLVLAIWAAISGTPALHD